MFIENLLSVMDSDQYVVIHSFNQDRETPIAKHNVMRNDDFKILRYNYWEVFRLYQGASWLHVYVSRISDEY